MTSFAPAIPKASLVYFEGLTLMLAVVVLFDPRTLWDIADEIGARRAPGRQRASSAGDQGARLQ